ncbi:MAG: DUF4364 family protein [Lachnospiraceae bacterium]|nr:DUF4364 family protein [Lachnospiraceae bacterium]
MRDPLTLYKLIVLYMLSKVDFPLTTTQIRDFLLGKEYTTFLSLQQAIGELTEAGFITSQSIRNRTHLSITPEGMETLNYFRGNIHEGIRDDIDAFFRENEFSLRNDVSVLADYYKNTSGEYSAHLTAKDHGFDLVDITLSVPSEETAISICDNWQSKNQDIYQYLIRQLFS